MKDLDDQTYRLADLRARRGAVDLIRDLFPMEAFPRRDLLGILRHGFARKIEQRPMNPASALKQLEAEVYAASELLARRVVLLLARQPAAAPKLKYLYAIGDLMDAERLRDWDDLWSALAEGRWDDAGAELVQTQWDKFMDVDKERGRAVMRMVYEVAKPPELQS